MSKLPHLHAISPRNCIYKARALVAAATYHLRPTVAITKSPATGRRDIAESTVRFFNTATQYAPLVRNMSSSDDDTPLVKATEQGEFHLPTQSDRRCFTRFVAFSHTTGAFPITITPPTTTQLTPLLLQHG